MKVKFYTDIFGEIQADQIYVNNWLLVQPKPNNCTRFVFEVDFPDNLFPVVDLGKVEAKVELPKEKK